VAYADVEYRLLDEAELPQILRDCARAVQFLRYYADKYNLDKKRVASFGSSAGAGTRFWLAMHDDLFN
jgi:acetyl esterase/lipase